MTREASRHGRVVWFVIGLLGFVSLVALGLALSPHRTIIGGVAVLVAVGLLKVIGERKLEVALRWARGAAAEVSLRV